MNRLTFMFLLLSTLVLAVSLAACAPVSLPPAPAQESAAPAIAISPAISTEAPTSLAASAIPSPLPTDTSLPRSPTPGLPIVTPRPGTVVLDFVALACRASWANGAFDLPCPGDMRNLAEGFIAPAEQAVAEGEIQVDAPVLIGLPGQGGAGHGAGLFGIYPPLLIQPSDSFHTVVACHESTDCNVEFALEYVDSAGKIHHDTGWSFNHTYGGGLVPVAVDLSPLAGQTVQLVLVVRDQGTPEDDWVLWIYPYVDRAGP